MDRDKLEKQIYNFSKEKIEHLEEKKKIRIIKDAIKTMGDGTGKLNLLIVIEELGELIEETIYYLKMHKLDIGIKEELIDNLIGIKFIEVLLFNNIEDDYEIYKKQNNYSLNFMDLILDASKLQQFISKLLRENIIKDDFKNCLFKNKYNIEKFCNFLIDIDSSNEETLKYLEDIKYLRQEERNINSKN